MAQIYMSKRENQTQFAQVEPIFEEVVSREDEAVLLAKKKKSRQRKIMFLGLFTIGVVLMILLEMQPGPAPTIVNVPAPSATPTPLPVDQSLLGRIQRARASMESIDLYQADLSFPPIDNQIMLDALPKEK